MSTKNTAFGSLKYFFLLTDIGFILYWLITFFQLIPGEYLFKDYNNPLMIAWNWSFFPLDLLISFTGLLSIYLEKKGSTIWRKMAMVSLVLTFTSGLQAISFWTFQLDFDPTWWIPNVYLLVYPLFFLPKFILK